jgi:hypothetical protein
MVRLLHVTTPSGELAKKKLLGEACANSFSRANRKISKHQSGTTTGMGRLIPLSPAREYRRATDAVTADGSSDSSHSCLQVPPVLMSA